MVCVNPTMQASWLEQAQLRPLSEELTMKYSTYNAEAYRLAMQNTKYNDEGKAVISADDEWANEPEWDDMFKQMKKQQ